MALPNNNDDLFKAPLPTTPSHRQNISLRKSSRRSTFLVAPEDLSEPPTENPNNSDLYNEQLKQEYETLRSLNDTLQTVIQGVNDTYTKIQDFGESVKQASHLLDVWINIQKRAQDTHHVLEDMGNEKSVSLFDL
ncbi:uncharacterized protein B0P05DRAFT_583558 [Gilbertella persicaria]|uniref:uncharacterized protein n=1 Tax=Gilbertella persicaria TaxID=101096 RepID=UPI00221F1F76|nr:uncharacterized protein B0P05DRAFT_583558 [Gilbertella persicaria]KAI8092296.1 hypothetical protein B0P05DRAFT_583558 [Gilbertella persicaria]